MTKGTTQIIPQLAAHLSRGFEMHWKCVDSEKMGKWKRWSQVKGDFCREQLWPPPRVWRYTIRFAKPLFLKLVTIAATDSLSRASWRIHELKVECGTKYKYKCCGWRMSFFSKTEFALFQKLAGSPLSPEHLGMFRDVLWHLEKTSACTCPEFLISSISHGGVSLGNSIVTRDIDPLSSQNSYGRECKVPPNWQQAKKHV